VKKIRNAANMLNLCYKREIQDIPASCTPETTYEINTAKEI
jgi:hypothetical protein